MVEQARDHVIGRDEESAVLEGVLSALHAGPAGIVLVGDAGVGKTTLWRAGVVGGARARLPRP